MNPHRVRQQCHEAEGRTVPCGVVQQPGRVPAACRRAARLRSAHNAKGSRPSPLPSAGRTRGSLRGAMRIATWNVNSLKARLDKVRWWVDRARPDVLLLHKNFGMRIDHLLATRPLAARTRWAEIDREARKGKPIPSDHAPLLIDIDEPGHPFDAGWASAESPIPPRHRP